MSKKKVIDPCTSFGGAGVMIETMSPRKQVAYPFQNTVSQQEIESALEMYFGAERASLSDIDFVEISTKAAFQGNTIRGISVKRCPSTPAFSVRVIPK